MATGIKDKVAILGMGCSKFGERWDAGSPELMAEAFTEALADAGIERKQIEAAWFGCYDDAINVGNSKEDMKRAISHVSWKSHQNGVHSPKAHFQTAVSMDTIMNAPMISDPLGLFDCSGVSDGSACAIVTTPEIACALGKTDVVTIKALQLSTSSGRETQMSDWDGSYIPNQLGSPSLGLTHNLGGVPDQGVAAISILGLS